MRDLQSAIERILEAAILLNAADGVVELRAPNAKRRGTVSGYFDDSQRLAEEAANLSGTVDGVYVTLNPVDPDLLARSTNRVRHFSRHTTSDQDVVSRVWLPVDFDPVRPAGISSTDAEHQAALDRAIECRTFLDETGWPAPIFADSGNGAHLLYRIAHPNDNESRDLVQRCLDALAFRFSDDAVAVDQKTGNAARIWKLYGTVAAKGDSTDERPHRQSELIDVPEPLAPVPKSLLRDLAELASSAAPPRASEPTPGVDVDDFIATSGMTIVRTGPWQGGRRWILATCPWNPDHTDPAAYIVQHASGAIAAGCHHNSCRGNGWRELRALYQNNLTSNHREVRLEVRFSREINGADLQTRARSACEDDLPSLPLLGRTGYVMKGWSHLLAGYPKVGKTELLVRLLQEWRAERIIVITEEPESVWKQRLRSTFASLGHVQFYFGLGAARLELLNRVDSGEETVVILDTVRNLLGLQDERDNSEVARAMIPFVDAARRGAKTIVFSHHDRKGGGEHGEAIAGAHAFLGLVDVGLEVRRDSQASRRRQIRGWARVVEIPDLVYEMTEGGDLVALGDPRELEIDSVVNRALALLSRNFETTRELLIRFDEPKPSDEQLRQALRLAADRGRAERNPPMSEGSRQGVTYRWRLAASCCTHRPAGEPVVVETFVRRRFGDATSACTCCGSLAGKDVYDYDLGLCPVCRKGMVASEGGGHLVRMALDMGGELVEEAG